MAIDGSRRTSPELVVSSDWKRGEGAAGRGARGWQRRGRGLGLGMVRLRKVGINNNKLRLICFMMFTLRPASE